MIGRKSCFFFLPFFKLVCPAAGFLAMVKLFKEWPNVPNRPWVVKQFVEDFEFYAHGRLTNTPPVYIWMLSLGISRGFAFVDFYHLQDATRWMETNQVASQSPSLVLILGIWKKKRKRERKKIPNGNQSFVETVGEKKGKPRTLMNLHKSNELTVSSDYFHLRVITAILRKYYCLCNWNWNSCIISPRI